MPDSKLDTLNNMFASGHLFKEENGKYKATLPGIAPVVKDISQWLDGMGLKNGTDYTVSEAAPGSPDVQVQIDPKKLPDPQTAKNIIPPAKVAQYAVDLGKTLGVTPKSATRYSLDKNHPFETDLKFETGNPEAADKLSAAVAGIRREMGMPKKDMPIGYKDGDTSFSVHASDIQQYEANHPGKKFIDDFNAAAGKMDVDEGKTYKQEIDEAKPLLKKADIGSPTHLASVKPEYQKGGTSRA